MKAIIVLFFFLGSICLTRPSFAQQAADSVITVTVRVVNLHCNNDMPTIKKRLLNQEGIDDVSFTERDGDLSVFTITYHTAATSEKQIHKAIEATPGCDDPSDKPYRVKAQKRKKGGS